VTENELHRAYDAYLDAMLDVKKLEQVKEIRDSL
jgi:hypothetical protein